MTTKKITNLPCRKSRFSMASLASPFSLRHVLLALALLFILFLISGCVNTKPLAGKAIDYGTPITNTAPGQWGFLTSDISAGGHWTHPTDGEKYDEFDAIVFVDFGSAGGSFSTFRLRVNYDNTIVEPLSITPLDEKHQNALTGNGIYASENSVLAYYTWSGSAAELGTYSITGRHSLFKVRFKVTADDFGVTTRNAISLQAVPESVLNDASGTSLGAYKSVSSNVDVQMIQATPSPAAITLTVNLPCVDVDGDGYSAQMGQYDRSACGSNFQAVDCDDGVASTHPGGTEVCNGVDDNCDGTVDDEIPAEFNTAPTGQSRLYGVCLDYKQCSGAAGMKNSYVENAAGVHYDSMTDGCDIYDNDCDGQLNEDAGAGCLVSTQGTLSGLLHDPGNVYLDFGQNTLESTQVVDASDITHTFILQQGYLPVIFQTGNFPAEPVCNKLGSGWVCVCKNGDYYETEIADGSSGFSYIDYSASTKTLQSTLSLVDSALKKNGVDVTCPTS